MKGKNMSNFNIKKLEPKKEKKTKLQKTLRIFRWGRLSVISIATLIGIYSSYLFVVNHEWRSPIVLQTPYYNDEIISPVGSESATLVPQVDAAEPENPYQEGSPKAEGWEVNKDKFGVEQWEALEILVFKESGWNPYNINPSSGACGLGQALPCEKMGCELWDYACQTEWIGDYIEGRYETPLKALAFWETKHLINGKMVNYY